MEHASPSPCHSAGCSCMQLQLQVADLSGKLQAAEHGLSLLRRQLITTTATTTRLEDSLTAAQLQIQELMAAKEHTAELSDSISRLHSRQQQLQQRQHLDECQRSLVFKCPTALPTAGAAPHLQQELRKLLQLQVTVQAVHPLGSKQRGDGSSGSSGGASRAASKHAYRVVLGSSGQRTEVMRIKALRLRGTPLSIDELLTPDQLASRQRLQPVARQAAAAGQRVRWQHGSLIIDGKPYTGPGSLPTPAEQVAAAAAKAGSPTQPLAAAQPAAADGWQTVQRRNNKSQRPSAGGSKKALFAASPSGKQQQRGAGAKKQGSGSKPAAKPKGTRAAKQQPKSPSSGSSGAAVTGGNGGSSGTGKQQQPAGGAGGALACVASQGDSQGDASAPTAQPAAGHGVSPPNAVPPPAAADGGSEEQPAAAGTAGGEVQPAAAGTAGGEEQPAAAGSAGGEQPPAEAAGGAAAPASPSARA